ncbi:SHOCT domain-containing protein [Streptomyces antimicrobicus]|uniref:PLD nuclease N-terminal domain-containing protein n=1 Tax=Streptomyces antimicrobicus TaxID=2883108 RepID=A0ABS8B4A9_9ACTN|nr:SHOCT domain-containing protein [Streptomyces antimicrobicus]MCB5179417.1 PLD nuclease N-terminal domain-containing protein [Streptomyces antimicrobicus]
MDDYPLLNAFLTMLWFFLWIMWFMLLFKIITDVFRDDSLGGWAKAGWTVFVCLLPFLGCFVYLLARGRGMGERDVSQMRRQEQAFRAYVQSAVETDTPRATVDELSRLAALRDHGDLSPAEYEQAKTKVLASH